MHHITIAEYMIFLNAQETFTKMGHIMYQKQDSDSKLLKSYSMSSD